MNNEEQNLHEDEYLFHEEEYPVYQTKNKPLDPSKSQKQSRNSLPTPPSNRKEDEENWEDRENRIRILEAKHKSLLADADKAIEKKYKKLLDDAKKEFEEGIKEYQDQLAAKDLDILMLKVQMEGLQQKSEAAIDDVIRKAKKHLSNEVAILKKTHEIKITKILSESKAYVKQNTIDKEKEINRLKKEIESFALESERIGKEKDLEISKLKEEWARREEEIILEANKKEEQILLEASKIEERIKGESAKKEEQIILEAKERVEKIIEEKQQVLLMANQRYERLKKQSQQPNTTGKEKEINRLKKEIESFALESERAKKEKELEIAKLKEEWARREEEVILEARKREEQILQETNKRVERIKREAVKKEEQLKREAVKKEEQLKREAIEKEEQLKREAIEKEEQIILEVKEKVERIIEEKQQALLMANQRYEQLKRQGQQLTPFHEEKVEPEVKKFPPQKGDHIEEKTPSRKAEVDVQKTIHQEKKKYKRLESEVDKLNQMVHQLSSEKEVEDQKPNTYFSELISTIILIAANLVFIFIIYPNIANWIEEIGLNHLSVTIRVLMTVFVIMISLFCFVKAREASQKKEPPNQKKNQSHSIKYLLGIITIGTILLVVFLINSVFLFFLVGSVLIILSGLLLVGSLRKS